MAAQAQDGDEIPGDLEFDGWTPLLGCPAGALATLGAVYLFTERRGRRDEVGAAAYDASYSYPG